MSIQLGAVLIYAFGVVVGIASAPLLGACP